MPNPRRAAVQLLTDWARSGLTHLPKPPAVEPHSGSATVPEISSQIDAGEDVPVAPADPQVLTSQIKPDMPRKSLTLEERRLELTGLAACVADCTRCPELARTRNRTVFGVGNPKAKVMFLGEAPGADEDRVGEPFVGRAGQLLTKIIEACGWTREEIYICNILRCRPPENRTPSPQEAANCREWLDGQIAIVNPKYIVCWGTCAAQNLLGVEDKIGTMRQRFYAHGKAKVLCTYHPSYLLRNPAAKKPVWDDMKLLLSDMGLTPPSG